MRDFSINLPTWARQLDYRLEGGTGTYDELYLYKGFEVVKRWGWLEKIPNLFEMEEFIRGLDDNVARL